LTLNGAATAQVGASQAPDGQAPSLPDNHNQGEWVEFTHTLGPDPQTLHPVKVYSQDYSTLWGGGKYATAFGQGTASNYMFGDGSDGDLTVASGQTYYTDDTRSALAASASADQSNLTLSNAAGFAVGHEVLVIQMQGTGAGNYEFGTIAAINGNTLTLQRTLFNTYTVDGTSKAQVIRVPHYQNVTVQSGGMLTAHPWQGNVTGTGGTVVFRARGTVSVAGSFNAKAIGYFGGCGGTYGTTGCQGESYNRLGSQITNRNDGGGGGGLGSPDADGADGGGGGGYGSVGQNGQNGGGGGTHIPGQGGSIYGDSSNLGNEIFFGSGGGGGGGYHENGERWLGGYGGGVVIVAAATLDVNGAINADGGNGESNPCTGSDQPPGCRRNGAGGGGAGGSIYILVNNGSLGASNNVHSIGGAGGTADEGGDGGAGGEGRIRIEYCDTFSGSTNPPASVAKINCYGTVYLPLVLRNYVAYFEGPWEVEPNNTYLQANGSLRSGRDYYGYPNDQKDYFSIYLRTGGQIVIDLSNHTGQGVQLQLFYQTAGNLVAGDLDAPYHIEYTGPAGLYYIYIYTAGNYNSNTAYTLRVTYP